MALVRREVGCTSHRQKCPGSRVQLSSFAETQAVRQKGFLDAEFARSEALSVREPKQRFTRLAVRVDALAARIAPHKRAAVFRFLTVPRQHVRRPCQPLPGPVGFKLGSGVGIEHSAGQPRIGSSHVAANGKHVHDREHPGALEAILFDTREIRKQTHDARIAVDTGGGGGGEKKRVDFAGQKQFGTVETRRARRYRDPVWKPVFLIGYLASSVGRTAFGRNDPFDIRPGQIIFVLKDAADPRQRGGRTARCADAATLEFLGAPDPPAPARTNTLLCRN